MQRHVAFTVAGRLYEGGAAPCQAFLHAPVECFPVIRQRIVKPVHFSGGAEGQPVRRPEVSFKDIPIIRLGQEGEYAAAVVVQHDDGGVQAVCLGGQQSVHIVI